MPGADDFALCRGHVYGTILVDIETRRPVDMLPERSAESFRSCLQEPPPEPESGPPAEQAAPPPEKGLAARTRARHAEVRAALARGLIFTEISRTLRLERKTVGPYATAATAGQLIGGPGAQMASDLVFCRARCRC